MGGVGGLGHRKLIESELVGWSYAFFPPSDLRNSFSQFWGLEVPDARRVGFSGPPGVSTCVLISAYKDTGQMGLGPPSWPHFTFIPL